jgi:hypothetical protein
MGIEEFLRVRTDPIARSGSGCSDAKTGTGFAYTKLSEILPLLAMLGSSG